MLGLPYQYVLKLLRAETGAYSVSALKKVYKIKRPLRNSTSEKLIKVKSLYDQLHTLQKVADELGVTRERIRQLLNKGEKQGLYEYELHRDKRFNELISNYGRDTIIEEIKHEISPPKICSTLNIHIDDFRKLLKHYDIDTKDYRDLARRSKCLKEYSKIVDELGTHPTTTEMNLRPSWRAIWARIDRYWGSIESFRKEYGIERPKHRIHANTLASFQNNIIKNKENKRIKMNNLINQICVRGPIGISEICAAIGISTQSAANYIKELLFNKTIAKQGAGRNTKYIMSIVAANQTALPF